MESLDFPVHDQHSPSSSDRPLNVRESAFIAEVDAVYDQAAADPSGCGHVHIQQVLIVMAADAFLAHIEGGHFNKQAVIARLKQKYDLDPVTGALKRRTDLH